MMPSYVLANEHPYAYPRHVEPVQERLDVGVDLQTLPFSLPLENTLCNSSNDAVVSPLDMFQGVGKPIVVFGQLGRPLAAVVGRDKISSATRGSFPAIAIAVPIDLGIRVVEDGGGR
jgi:hypothetical protein